MSTKIKILATAPAPAMQIAETAKWVLRFVGLDPAGVKLQRLNQHRVFRLVSKDGTPVSASALLREQLASQEVELIEY